MRWVLELPGQLKMSEFVFEMARLRHKMVMWGLQMVELGFKMNKLTI